MARENTPFENIEGALEYVTCLLDACRIAQSQVEKEISPLQPVRPTRKLDALKLVDFKLEKLTSHLAKSERLLKDLRRLRRIILDERTSVGRATSCA